MNEYHLHVRGSDERGANRIRPVFVWKAPEGCRQFTIEMSRKEDFSEIIFLRDTRECYYVYDNVPLYPETTYYLRVRCGLGPWSTISFQTEGDRI